MRSNFSVERMAGSRRGARVKVVGADIGARDVEFEGRRFRIAMPCVDNGLEFWVDGKWISETPVLEYGHGQD